MIDLERLCQLYTTAHDATKSFAQRAKASELLAAIDADKLIEEFLPTLVHEFDGVHDWDYKKGDPRYKCFADFANSVTFFLTRRPGESNDDFHTRENRIRADKLGCIVRHVLTEKARALRTSDFDFVRLFGDEFSVALWPPHGSALGLPDPTPNEITIT